MVAVRSTGLGLDAIVGCADDEGSTYGLVSENYLRRLVAISNERFKVNRLRIQRFRAALEQQLQRQYASKLYQRPHGPTEDRICDSVEARRQRKRTKGMQVQANPAAKITNEKEGTDHDSQEYHEIEYLFGEL
jgi:tRNA wybutosine-synthesizing protein 3